MAISCSKCGAEILPDAQSCPACGTPIAAQAAPAQPVAVPPPAPPAVAQPKSGSSALKIVLIVVAVFVLLGILVVSAFGYFAWRIAHTVRVNKDKVTVTVPGSGGFSASTGDNYSASDLGVDPYPGAKTAKGGMRMTLPTGTMITAVYITSDSKDQVLAFYKDKLGKDVSTVDTSEGAILTLKKSDQEQVMVTITANSSDNEGKTQITIVHTTSNKS